jgi:hypothetical protein
MATSENISFGRAFSYISKKAGYLIPLIIVTVVGIAGSGYAIHLYNNGGDGKIPFIAIAISVAAFGFALLKAPADIAANTTVEEADRGVYIR